MRPALLLLLLPLAACLRDETAARYGAADHGWRLSEVAGAVAPYAATLHIAPGGAATGTAPCNSYAAHLSAPYPWFALTDFTVTERTCSGLAAEQGFFETLRAMTLIEVLGDTLILRDDAGREMLFRAAPAAG